MAMNMQMDKFHVNQDLRNATFKSDFNIYQSGGLAFGQFPRYFSAVLFAVGMLRLTKSSKNALNLAKCISPVKIVA